ncbi:SDR family NAD(P)-dependent oxidoreductase (plasmid) [Ensifer adhaerens]|uniref:SDR family NAD(P)-dependent oxidoreductase n=1 Tax=Ensifer adhaerens TaxID=106592 RepID=UPI0023A92FC4|nr:SDR family oxidoreductase [Ensifer adhaerens]WDZ79195.1 SDR family NAD(P)-dependent oxidoreductase [Ensifer adhaerens]
MSARVLITGAYRGIGAACALAFAATGARVALADIRRPDETADAVTRAGASEILTLACDVSDEASVAAMGDAVRQAFGGLDIVVHCAGVIHEAPLLETPAADFDRVIAINLRGSFLVGKMALGLMEGTAEAPARLIMIASDMAYYGRETFSPYVASKHGVLGLVRSWAKEFAPRVLVNAICPGPIDTEMLGAAHMSAEWRAKELAIPLARFGKPEEIGELALFLAGSGGRYFTGQGIGSNGGSIMP